MPTTAAPGFAVVLLASLASLGALAGCPQGRVLGPSSDGKLTGAVSELVAPLVEDQWAAAVVVAVVRPGSVETYGFGQIDGKDGGVPTAATRFELGSISKVFTALALAQLVQDGSVTLETKVVDLLPPGTAMPAGGEGITLLMLATHTSGLPSLPGNLSIEGVDPADPYAAYDIAALYAGLAQTSLATPPGTAYAYSNLGMGLLGHALARKAGVSYDELVRTRVTGPLGLTATSTDGGVLATPHDADGQAQKPWAFTDAFAGAGGLRGTARDLVVLAQAMLAPATVPDAATRAALEATWSRRADRPGGEAIALGWHMGLDADGALREVRWHNGGTGGGRTFMALDRKAGAAVIVLSTTTTDKIDALGLRLLRMARGEPGMPLGLPRTKALAPAAFDPLVGRYALSAAFTLDVTREGNALYVQATDQPRFRLWAISETHFILHVVDAALEFRLGPDGRATSVTLQQAGQSAEGARVP